MPEHGERKHVHVHIHEHGHVYHSERLLALVERLCVTLERIGAVMAASLDALTAEVSAVRTVHESAVRLIEGIAQRIIDAGVDPAALQVLVDDLHSSSMALSAAVEANTVPPMPMP